MVYTGATFSGVSDPMIAGILFLCGLLFVVLFIAYDPRRVFWRDPRRRDSRGVSLAHPLFLVVGRR